jgi:predicted alpha/beta hydrolase
MTDERVPLFYVGHSFGGHALGLLPNHDRIARAYLFAMGAGWHGWMPPLERVRAQVLWNVVLPVRRVVHLERDHDLSREEQHAERAVELRPAPCRSDSME